jgi:tRNA (guanine-N7-)-methyltransferase
LLAAELPRIGIDLNAAAEPLDPKRLFGPGVGSIRLEIGFGGGEHLLAEAKRHPEVGFIGCEPYVNGVVTLLRHVVAGKIANVRIVMDDARPLLAVLAEASVGEVDLLFPDPWPKRRHHKRRFVSAANLDALARVLADGGAFRFASDHAEYARWTLWHVRRHPAFEWTAETAADWRPGPAQPATRYARKAAAVGQPAIYLGFRRRSRGA